MVKFKPLLQTILGSITFYIVIITDNDYNSSLHLGALEREKTNFEKFGPKQAREK
jgi:hypothetical protein